MCRATDKAKEIINKVFEQHGDPAVEESGIERASPKGRIPKENVRWDKDTKELCIKFDKKPWLTGVNALTNSMEPFIDDKFTMVIQKQFEVDDLQVGDVIVYDVGTLIIHKIAYIEYDDRGIFFRCKGLNNKGLDAYKVRPESIRGILLMPMFTSEKVVWP